MPSFFEDIGNEGKRVDSRVRNRGGGWGQTAASWINPASSLPTLFNMFGAGKGTLGQAQGGSNKLLRDWQWHHSNPAASIRGTFSGKNPLDSRARIYRQRASDEYDANRASQMSALMSRRGGFGGGAAYGAQNQATLDSVAESKVAQDQRDAQEQAQAMQTIQMLFMLLGA